jgi:hypothetical protein
MFCNAWLQCHAQKKLRYWYWPEIKQIVYHFLISGDMVFLQVGINFFVFTQLVISL